MTRKRNRSRAGHASAPARVVLARWGVALGVLLAVAGAGGAQPRENPEAWLTAGAYGEFHVVIPAEASEDLQYAARVFQAYWKRCTGFEPGIGTENGAQINVWLGREVAERNVGRLRELDSLGPGGFVARSFTPLERDQALGARKQLVLSGVDDAATVDAVFAFFQEALGVRWLAPGVVHAPRAGFHFLAVNLAAAPVFPAVAVAHAPLGGTADELAEYLRAHRIGAPGDTGFFPLHPRITLEGPAENAAQALRARLADFPGARRIGVAWADESLGLAERLEAVGALREALDEPRLNLVLLLPRGHRAPPPPEIRVPEGVGVELDATGIDWRRPLRDRATPANAEFVAQLRAWRRLDVPVYVRMPIVDENCPFMPLPVWPHLRDNLQVLAQNEVAGVELVAGSPNSPHYQDLAALRAFLGARLLRDPDLSMQHELPHFLRGYYGAGAAPRVQAHLDSLQAAAPGVPWTPDGLTAWWREAAPAAATHWTNDVPTSLPAPHASRLAQVALPALAARHGADPAHGELAAAFEAAGLAQYQEQLAAQLPCIHNSAL